ncbi:IS481 family transposase, partial [Amorphus sp. 3PC139-8]|uniref:IS481 family transposase n=1 Tax=Amorphus sp. 3PC139-8 TaxID=2735676 RepID=UPI00345CABBA
MNIHENARLTPFGRERLVQAMLCGQTPQAAARDAGVCPRTARKWLARYQAEGVAGLKDRSSRPRRLRAVTAAEVKAAIIRLRQQRFTGKHIAGTVGVSRATVSRVLRAAKLSRATDLEPRQPVRRYEHARPGDMIHLDIKKLGRFERPGHRVTGDRTGQSTPRNSGKPGYGWEFVHVTIDDHSRLSFTELHPDEKAVSAVAHLKASVAWYTGLGVKVRRVMTDNGPCYTSKAFAKACRDLGLKHIRTKPYTPRTNGKAERFIQTALREWAYGRPYRTSDERAQALPIWTHLYNWHRPHSGIDDQTPISRLALSRDNLLRLH